MDEAWWSSSVMLVVDGQRCVRDLVCHETVRSSEKEGYVTASAANNQRARYAAQLHQTKFTLSTVSTSRTVECFSALKAMPAAKYRVYTTAMGMCIFLHGKSLCLVVILCIFAPHCDCELLTFWDMRKGWSSAGMLDICLNTAYCQHWIANLQHR